MKACDGQRYRNHMKHLKADEGENERNLKTTNFGSTHVMQIK